MNANQKNSTNQTQVFLKVNRKMTICDYEIEQWFELYKRIDFPDLYYKELKAQKWDTATRPQPKTKQVVWEADSTITPQIDFDSTKILKVTNRKTTPKPTEKIPEWQAWFNRDEVKGKSAPIFQSTDQCKLCMNAYFTPEELDRKIPDMTEVKNGDSCPYPREHPCTHCGNNTNENKWNFNRQPRRFCLS